MMLVHFNITIFGFALANEEPRGAWKTLLDSGFGGGNSEQTALRADHIFGSETLFEILRYSLYKIRTYFESNPDDTEY
jgi:hypothetical protein